MLEIFKKISTHHTLG